MAATKILQQQYKLDSLEIEEVRGKGFYLEEFLAPVELQSGKGFWNGK